LILVLAAKSGFNRIENRTSCPKKYQFINLILLHGLLHKLIFMLQYIEIK